MEQEPPRLPAHAASQDSAPAPTCLWNAALCDRTCFFHHTPPRHNGIATNSIVDAGDVSLTITSSYKFPRLLRVASSSARGLDATGIFLARIADRKRTRLKRFTGSS